MPLDSLVSHIKVVAKHRGNKGIRNVALILFVNQLSDLIGPPYVSAFILEPLCLEGNGLYLNLDSPLLARGLIEAAGVGLVLLDEPTDQRSLYVKLGSHTGVSPAGHHGLLNNAPHGLVAEHDLATPLEPAWRTVALEGNVIFSQTGPVFFLSEGSIELCRSLEFLSFLLTKFVHLSQSL